MKPNERQQQILKVFKGDKDLVLSKRAIIARGEIGYFRNTDKHVGDTLTRLINNGLLTRPKRGYYQLGLKNKRPAPIDPNQTDLFK